MILHHYFSLVAQHDPGTHKQASRLGVLLLHEGNVQNYKKSWMDGWMDGSVDPTAQHALACTTQPPLFLAFNSSFQLFDMDAPSTSPIGASCMCVGV